MVNQIRSLFSRVEFLTHKDLKAMTHLGIVDKWSASLRLYASLVEEVGELARAIKIEQGMVRGFKEFEPSPGEAADVGICGIAVFYAAGGTNEDIKSLFPFFENPNDSGKMFDIFECLAKLSEQCGMLGKGLMFCHSFGQSAIDNSDFYPDESRVRDMALSVVQTAVLIFEQRSGNSENLIGSMHEKLNKWEHNQYDED